MLVQRRLHYRASVAEVVALLTDESLLSAKYRELGQPAPDRIAADHHGDQVEVREHRHVRVPTPRTEQPWMGTEPMIDFVERWEPEAADGSRRAVFEARSTAVPLQASGVLVLTPDGDAGCDCDVLIDLISEVPIIGGRIVAAAAQSATEIIDASYEANQSFLRRRRSIVSPPLSA